MVCSITGALHAWRWLKPEASLPKLVCWGRFQGLCSIFSGITTIIAGAASLYKSVDDIFIEDPRRNLWQGWLVCYIVYGGYKCCEQAFYVFVGFTNIWIATALKTPVPEVSELAELTSGSPEPEGGSGEPSAPPAPVETPDPESIPGTRAEP